MSAHTTSCASSSWRSRCRSWLGAKRSAGRSRCRPPGSRTSMDVERATLEDLAAASRILVDQGVFDAAGHVSMRHPKNPNRFLISRSLAPEMVTADDIMLFDLNSNAIDAGGRRGFIERYLHGEIYRARPDVMAVAHSHSPSVIAFGLTQTPLRAMYHNAAFLAAGVPVF